MEPQMSDDWRIVSLKDVTVDVKSWDPSAERVFTYVDISSIDNQRCEIVEAKRLSGAKAPSRARRPLRDGDVLFSNVRTYLRNVAQVQGLDPPAVASTGFTLLRPTPDLNSRFLYHLARSDFFIGRVTPEQTGTHYPATSDRVVRGQEIALPPLAKQQSIAELIDRVESSRRSAASHLQEAQGSVERFRQAVLSAACSGRLTADWRSDNESERPEIALQARRDLERRRLGKNYRQPFKPDPDNLPVIPEQWMWSTLPELGDLGRGRSKHRPRNDPKLYGGEYPFIQTGDVARSGGRITDHSQTYNELGLAQSRLWPARTICITIAANIADSGLLTYPAAFPDSVVGLIADESVALPEYVELFIRTARNDLAAFAPATAQANINLAILSELAIALPPVEEQRQIVERVDVLLGTASRLAARLEGAAHAVEYASQAVLTKAFHGELAGIENGDV